MLGSFPGRSPETSRSPPHPGSEAARCHTSPGSLRGGRSESTESRAPHPTPSSSASGRHARCGAGSGLWPARSSRSQWRGTSSGWPPRGCRPRWPFPPNLPAGPCGWCSRDEPAWRLSCRTLVRPKTNTRPGRGPGPLSGGRGVSNCSRISGFQYVMVIKGQADRGCVQSLVCVADWTSTNTSSAMMGSWYVATQATQRPRA